MLFATDTLAEMFATLHETQFEFHLTGSRFFNTANIDSDWDFFVEDSMNVRKFLLSLNFVRTASYGSLGTNISTVLEHRELPIHIQLVADVQKKLDAQQKLIPYSERLRDKETAKILWDIAQGS